MPHPAMSPNNVTVITGGASGIGLAAATHFAALGMKVCIADIGTERLAEAAAKQVTDAGEKKKQAEAAKTQTQPQLPTEVPAAKLATRADALQQSPRLKIETPSLQGSIALKGGLIDDLTLVKS